VFSSRRRHTRFSRDWSSDVCSSDLSAYAGIHQQGQFASEQLSIGGQADVLQTELADFAKKRLQLGTDQRLTTGDAQPLDAGRLRSEERRVGKGRRPRWPRLADATRQ